MEDTPENRERFPQHGNQKEGVGFPIARLVAILSHATGAVLGIAMAPYSGKGTGEHALFRELHGCLSKGDVLVADAYYCSYFLIAALQVLGVDFVFEQHGARKTKFRNGVRLGKRDHISILHKPTRPAWMTEEEYASYPAEISVREVKVRGKVLVTSFLSSKEVHKDELGRLFEQRWHVEVDLRNIKTTLGMEMLACRSPGMCEKEVWVYMLAYNTIRLLMAESALRAGAIPRQLSFKHAVQVWLAWAYRGTPLNTEAIDIMCRRIARVRVGKRSGRVEPRAIKRRPKAFVRLTTTREQARRQIRRRGHVKKLVA
jgi:Transposase DDE domain